MSQLNVDTIKNRLGTAGPTTPSLTVTDGATAGSVTVGSAVTINSTGVNVTGVVTATSFVGDGSQLSGITASGGGSGDFNTGITSVAQFNPISYDTTVFTFPSTAGREYIIYSINASNVSNTEINLIAALNYNANSRQVHLAYNVPVEPGGSVELLKQPHIANPSDFLTMWTTDTTYAGVSSAMEVYMTYTQTTDSNYFGVGVSTVSLATTALTGIFTSTTYPSVIQSIHLVNRTDDGDYPVSVQITNGVSTSYLVKDLVVPRYSTVEICDNPKRIQTNGIIRVSVAATNTIDVSVSGKYITG